jgi:serine/threonine protein kinase
MVEEEKELLGTFIGNYKVESFIGAGGMGSVYLGVHPDIGKKVAIKILTKELSDNPQMSERFVFEAKAVNQIEHPNIVEIYDFGRMGDNRLYYTMELLKGSPLDDLMSAKRFSISETTNILNQISSALEAVHSHGIVHRDLKPENIFVNNKGGVEIVKLLDFGIAKLLTNDGSQGFKTATGVIMGTPYYMSPEQAKGEMDLISPRSDIYSLGVILYQMLCGELPISGNSMGAILVNQITQIPKPLTEMIPNFPPVLWDSIEKSLEKDPSVRYENIGEFSKTFSDASGHVPPTTIYGIQAAVAIGNSNSSISGGAFTTARSSISGVVLEDSGPKSKMAVIIIAFIIIFSGAGAAAYFLLFNKKSSDENYDVAKDKVALKTDVKPVQKPQSVQKDVKSLKVIHITVKSNIPKVKVEVKIPGKPDFFYETPFTLNLTSGQILTLRTQKDKYEQLVKKVTVTKDNEINLKLNPVKKSGSGNRRRKHRSRRHKSVKIKPIKTKPVDIVKPMKVIKKKTDSDSNLKIF